jgi:hypothetical protein
VIIWLVENPIQVAHLLRASECVNTPAHALVGFKIVSRFVEANDFPLAEMLPLRTSRDDVLDAGPNGRAGLPI